MIPQNGASGEALVLIAAGVAIQLAQGRSEQDLLYLSAFFEVLGDNLALIATQRADLDKKRLCQDCVKSPQTIANSGDIV